MAAARTAAAILTAERRRAARENNINLQSYHLKHDVARSPGNHPSSTDLTHGLTLARSEFNNKRPPSPCPHQAEFKARYDSSTVQIIVAFIIFLNFVVEAIKSQVLPEKGSPADTVFVVFEFFFNIVFLIELAWNMYGSWFWLFWDSGWNWFDFIIVGISIISIAFPTLPGITVLRLFRAFRVFRLFKRIDSLKKIIEGVLHAIPGVSQAFMIMLILMGIWSVIGVEFYRDLAPQEFGNFLKAMFTMFQVMTMDFSTIARRLIYLHGQWFAAVFFITYIFITGIVMTNVVVAILLDRYLAAMDKNMDNEENKDPEKDAEEHCPVIYLLDDGIMRPVKSVTWNEWDKILKYIHEAKDMVVESRPFSAKPIEER